jgi:uncharacterized ion transporter superfamily protein YfcC
MESSAHDHDRHDQLRKILIVLFAAGGATAIALESKAMDTMIDYAIYKLKDKGVDILMPSLAVIFMFLRAFAGGDYIIAMIPIGLMLAKKLRLDPMCGFALIIVAIILGSTSSPTDVMLPQLFMGVPLYSGFGVRLLLMLPICAMVAFYIWRYAKKVSRDPSNSILGKSEWYEELDSGDTVMVMEEVHVDGRSIAIVILYFLQPIIIVLSMSKLGYGMEVMPAIMIVNAFIMGIIAKFSLNDIAKYFAKGCATMAFIGFIIAVANTMSLVMSEGHILHTIVYALTNPLRNLGVGLSAIGISFAVTLLNLIIPSASAKVAILCPIITPMCEALQIPLQIGVSAFKYGDAVTNTISPVIAPVIGGLPIAIIPYNKYVKWCIPLVIVILVYCYITLYVMGVVGWTGGV